MKKDFYLIDERHLSLNFFFLYTAVFELFASTSDRLLLNGYCKQHHLLAITIRGETQVAGAGSLPSGTPCFTLTFVMHAVFLTFHSEELHRWILLPLPSVACFPSDESSTYDFGKSF